MAFSDEGLTKKQRRLVLFLHEYWAEYGERPTLSIIVKGSKLSSNRSAVDMLRNLVARGYLEQAPKISKSTRLTTKAMHEIDQLNSAPKHFSPKPLVPQQIYDLPTSGHATLKSSVSPIIRQDIQQPGTSSFQDEATKLLQNVSSFLAYVGTGDDTPPRERPSDRTVTTRLIITLLVSAIIIPIFFGRGVLAALAFITIISIITKGAMK